MAKEYGYAEYKHRFEGIVDDKFVTSGFDTPSEASAACLDEWKDVREFLVTVKTEKNRWLVYSCVQPYAKPENKCKFESVIMGVLACLCIATNSQVGDVLAPLTPTPTATASPTPTATPTPPVLIEVPRPPTMPTL
jgi:hypothetical protein